MASGTKTKKRKTSATKTKKRKTSATKQAKSTGHSCSIAKNKKSKSKISPLHYLRLKSQ